MILNFNIWWNSLNLQTDRIHYETRVDIKQLNKYVVHGSQLDIVQTLHATKLLSAQIRFVKLSLHANIMAFCFGFNYLQIWANNMPTKKITLLSIGILLRTARVEMQI